MLFVPLHGFTRECPRAENVTSRARDITLQDARRKAKMYIFTKENDKNNSIAQCKCNMERENSSYNSPRIKKTSMFWFKVSKADGGDAEGFQQNHH